MEFMKINSIWKIICTKHFNFTKNKSFVLTLPNSDNAFYQKFDKILIQLPLGVRFTQK